MTYKIIDIEGVGEAYAPKLNKAGIVKVSDLLAKCAAPKGRAALAEETGISEKLILKWTNHADLFRIKGVGPQFAEAWLRTSCRRCRRRTTRRTSSAACLP